MTVCDGNGALLKEGGSVTIVKDLKVMGAIREMIIPSLLLAILAH